jgi:hypothetical protein
LWRWLSWYSPSSRANGSWAARGRGGFDDSPKPDGSHRANVDGEWFVDTWATGLLRRREVFATADSKRAAVLVDYQPGGSRERPADRVVLDNRAYGYRIEIETMH